MKTETQELIDKAVKKWKELKTAETIMKVGYGDGIETKLGTFYWDNPLLLWLLSAGSEDDFDGSQTQIGLAQDGTLRWEYQSHCSCDDYENSSSLGEIFPPDDMTKHSLELGDIPPDWESQIQENLKKILP